MALRVALATAAGARGRDDDEPALLAALAGLGIEADVAVWDDPAVDWGAYALVVVRSTWDYPHRHAQFLDWAEQVESLTRLRNRAAVLRSNTDKRYLADLERAGLPTVPTVWAPPGEPVHLPGGEVVVKPVVSVGALDTARYAGDDQARALAHVRRLHVQGRAAMVQPYLPEALAGEVALVHVSGEYSHAAAKRVSMDVAPAGGLFAPEHISGIEADASEREVAERAIATLVDDPADLLYARVDLVRTAGHGSLLLEVELTEPSLFLHAGPGATERFARAIAATAAGGRA